MGMDEFVGAVLAIAQALCATVVLAGGYLAFAYGGYFNRRRSEQADSQVAATTKFDPAAVGPRCGARRLKRYAHAGADLE